MKVIALFVLGMVLSVSSWAYQLTIVQPTQNQTILYPSADVLNIEVQTNKSIDALDTLRIRLDDKLVATNQNTIQYPINQIGMGRHTLLATIENERGQVIAQDSRAFTVIINPAIPKKARQAQMQAQKQAEYDALPWYKKMRLKLTQDDLDVEMNTTNQAQAIVPQEKPKEPQTNFIQGVQIAPLGIASNNMGVIPQQKSN